MFHNFIFLFFSAGAVNDMKIHPKRPNILLSASADNSLRLWNVYTSVCVAIFAGEIHNSQVLTADFDIDGKHFVSGGMDHNLVLWKLETEEIKDVMNRSVTHKDGAVFKPIRLYEPNFSTRQIHNNYVDSVCWFGTTSFISRSLNGEIVIWKLEVGESGFNLKSTKVSMIHKLKEEDPENDRIWFVRAQLDHSGSFLAIGDLQGKIHLWDLRAGEIKKSTVSHPKSTKTIRMISFSLDGSIMVACSDDGKILRFDKKEKYKV